MELKLCAHYEIPALSAATVFAEKNLLCKQTVHVSDRLCFISFQAVAQEIQRFCDYEFMQMCIFIAMFKARLLISFKKSYYLNRRLYKHPVLNKNYFCGCSTKLQPAI